MENSLPNGKCNQERFPEMFLSVYFQFCASHVSLDTTLHSLKFYWKKNFFSHKNLQKTDQKRPILACFLCAHHFGLASNTIKNWIINLGVILDGYFALNILNSDRFSWIVNLKNISWKKVAPKKCNICDFVRQKKLLTLGVN